MAGMGSRFSNAGYTAPKPLIDIFGRPMIQHVADSINIDGDWVFIVQKQHREQYGLDQLLNQLRPGCRVIDTGGVVTDGAARSVLLTKDYIDNDRPLFVINSDNIIDWDHALYQDMIDTDTDGLILCFKDTNPKWSFAQAGADGLVTRVAEKDPISDCATAGLYIWRRGSDFVAAAEQMISKDIRVNNEFYICPVYNENIAMGQRIKIGMVREMNGVGTPEDLEFYIKSKTQ